MNFKTTGVFCKIVDIGSPGCRSLAHRTTGAEPAGGDPEGELDQQLLIRQSAALPPTEAGRFFYTHARTILRQCEQAQPAVNNVVIRSAAVSIGLVPGTAASAITMLLLQTVRNELPEVMVYLQESSGTILNDKLLSGQLDMAVRSTSACR